MHCAIGQLHHHGCLSSEPLMYIGYSGEAITLFYRNRATRLHQVLVHVFQKEVHQFHFLFKMGRILIERVVQFITLTIDIVNVVGIRHHDQSRAVIVHYTDAIIGQLVPKTVLI